MANPTSAAIAAIRARVSDWGSTDASIRNALNAADQPNPQLQGAVPKPMVLSLLMSKVGNANRGKLNARPSLTQAVLDIRAGDRDAVKNWAQLFLDSSDLSSTEVASILAEVEATIPDPAWPPLVSWAELNIGRPVDTDDIRKARP